MTQTTQQPETTGGIGLVLRGVRRVFRDHSSGRQVPVIDGISLEVLPGEFASLLGPSGCGKSTLLRLIAGLDKPDAGQITLHQTRPSQEPADGKSRIAYVFQDPHLLPWRNVLGNVELPLELMGVAAGTRREAATEVIEQVGLSDAVTRYPAQLSGGMRMRVSLARALVTDPQLLLLDEPFAALDEITRQSLDQLLRTFWIGRGVTVLFVTHSIQEAAYLSRRVVVLSSRPAKIVAEHAINLPADRPQSIRTELQFAEQTKALFESLQRGSSGR